MSNTSDPEFLQQRIAELEHMLAQSQQKLQQSEGKVKQLESGGEEQKPEPAPAPAPTSESTMEVASIRDGDATLQRLIQRIAMILQADKIAIMFYEKESGDLIGIPPGYGVDNHQLEKFKVRATQGISGQVFRDGQPVIYHNASTDTRTRKDMVSLLGVTNGITVPLIIEHRDEENRVVDRQTIGVLHAINKRHGDDFNDEDVRLLERMARNVGSIIANLQLYREVLQQREELLQTFESLTSGLMLISPEGKVSQMNAVARAVCEVEATGYVGQEYKEVLCNHEGIVEMIDEGLGGGEPKAREITLRSAGTERFYEAQGAGVMNEEGRSLGFVLILNDLTEMKNIDRMKSAFVAMASHELRTPLTAIKGFASTLLEGVESDMYTKEDQNEFLGIINSECDRLRRLIDDLLNTARIEANESLKPSYGKFNLPELLQKVVVIQKQSTNRHNVFAKISDDVPAEIIGDSDKLDQSMTNLLNNAIKYSPDGGDVILHAKLDPEDPTYVLLGVEDQGMGIPQDHLEKVFDRFHRVDNDDNRKIYGTGLGLFLVKHLIEQVHLGKIWAESEVGVGSTFWARIPIELDIEKAQEINE